MTSYRDSGCSKSVRLETPQSKDKSSIANRKQNLKKVPQPGFRLPPWTMDVVRIFWAFRKKEDTTFTPWANRASSVGVFQSTIWRHKKKVAFADTGQTVTIFQNKLGSTERLVIPSSHLCRYPPIEKAHLEYNLNVCISWYTEWRLSFRFYLSYLFNDALKQFVGSDLYWHLRQFFWFARLFLKRKDLLHVRNGNFLPRLVEDHGEGRCWKAWIRELRIT